MKLYEKEYLQLDDKKSRVMIAKACKSFMSSSSKLTQVHISPVTHEKHDTHTMEFTHSGDRCIRLVFSKPYAANQRKAMMQEIRTLASQRLQETLGSDDVEAQAFKEALESLSKE